MRAPSPAVPGLANVARQRTHAPLLFAIGLLLLCGLLLATTTPAQAAESCVVDSAGVNDVNGQSDLTRLCVDPAGLPSTLAVKWQWDPARFSGGNTGDACSLFDTDGDGNANYSLCLTVDGDPAAYVSHRLYSCTDNRNDRCSGPTAVTNTSTCTASVQGTEATPVDPFLAGNDYPEDTVGSCTVNMANLGGATNATFIDVCAYNSSEPNSNPVDCVVYRTNSGKLEVRKSLSPAENPDLFNLLIDNSVQASAVGNGGTTGERVVTAGTHTVAETTSGSTNLNDYTTAIQCRSANGTGSIVASSTSAGPLSVSVPDNSDIVCVITNTRKTGSLQVTKTVDWNGIAPGPTQIFQICISGPMYPTPNCQSTSSAGGTLTWNNLWTGVYNIAETDPGSAWTVTTSASSVNVTGSHNATITNTRKRGSLIVTKTVDWNGVASDPAKTFPICIAGPSYTTANCQAAPSNGGTLTWNNLIPGSYAVTETDPGSEWAVAIATSPVVVPVDGTAAAVTVSNTHKRGSLTVTKVADWQGIAVDPAQTFEICITGPSFAVANCQIAGATGGALNWTDLLPGAYTVVETDPGPQWATSISGSPATVVSGGQGAAVAVFNTRKLGALQVTKTVEWRGVTPDTNQTFQICITGPTHPTGDCQTAGSSGGALTWSGLLPGTYSVSETDPGSMWVVQLPPAPVPVGDTGGTAAAAVLNTHKLGNLQVEKIVNWNGSPPDSTQMFTICITGPSYPVGNCQTAPANGALLSWNDLLPGEYSVSEAPLSAQWSTTFAGSPAQVAGDGSTANASVTNTRKRGSLTVTKVVEWHGISPDPSQTFQICITGPSYPNGNCQAIGYTGGALTWSSLVPGTYNISESVLGSEWGVTINPTEVLVPGDGTAAGASVVNERKLGAIDVTKVVQWNGITPDENQTFALCISGPSYPSGDCQTLGFGGGAVSWTSLIPGAYSVYETDPGAEWAVTVGNPNVTVPANGGTAAASVTNTRKRGSLTVGKVVNWNGVPADSAATFAVCITGPSYPSGDCQVAPYNGGTLQWNDLLPGAYSVSETDPGGEWAVQVSGSPAAVPANGGGAAASVTNSRKLGSLAVTKTVQWNGVPADSNQSFAICIVGPSHPNADCKNIGANGGTLTWDNLIPGSYEVAENSPGGAWDFVVSGSPASVPLDGGQAAAAVTNSRKLGSLAVTKTVNWNGVAADSAKTFELCITGPSYPLGNCKIADYDGAVLTWTGLIPGNYTVAETFPGSEWQVEVAGSPAEVPLTGGEAAASVTNTRKLGSLQVTKNVNWNGITPDTGKVFQVCIAGPSYPSADCKPAGSAGGVLTWTDLIPGAYAVGEVNPGPQWLVEIGNEQLVVPADGGAAATTVTNTRKRGSLTVTKIVEWNGIPFDAAQGFTVCITGPSYATANCKTFGANGGALTWTNLLPGIYDVAESDPGSAWTVQIDDALAVVPENGAGGSATVTNSRKLGSLQVNKTVNWNGIAPVTEQTFQICITGPSYPTGDCKTVSYQGGQVNWSSLIPGEYAVSEAGPGSEWMVQVTGSPAAVPVDGGQASAAVGNARKLGGFQVTKLVDWNGVAPERGQTFEICITGPSYPLGNCQRADYDGGVLAWANLIPGSYTLAETDPGSQWLVTQSASSVTVPSDGTTAAASVSNTRKRGSLTVTKLVNWNGVPRDAAQQFEICITGPSFPQQDCQMVGPNGGTLNWLDLLPGVYTVSEISPGVAWTAAVNPTQVTVPADGGGASASVVNTRKLGSLDVTKTVDWNGVPTDNQAAFEICIAGPSYPTGNCKPLGYGGGALAWPDLIPGDYVVTEANAGAEWNVQISGSPAAVPLDGGSVRADVTNTRKLGSLQVTKTVNWNGAPVDDSQVFQICITGPSYPTGSCRTAGAAGGALLWTDLIPGDYTVAETEPGSQWAVQNGRATVTVPADGGQAEANITNSRKLGSLDVTKIVAWNGVTPDQDKVFQICITGPSFPTGACQDADFDGGMLAWNSLIPGQYTVAETNPGAEWAVQLPGTAVTVPADGGRAAASVSNSRRLGSLQVTKTVNWNSVIPDQGKVFQICITGPSYPSGNCQNADFDGGVLAWANLIPGAYTVAETAPGTEWQVVVDGLPAAVPTDGGEAAASVSNSRRLGSLQVTKTVNWNGVTPDEAQRFQICIAGPSYPGGDCQEAGPSGAMLTWSNLIPGDYSISETDPGSAWAVTLGNSLVTVPADGGEVAAAVTNSRRHGSLTVTKTVNWNGVPADEAQTFQICITGPSFPQGDCRPVDYDGGVLNWEQLLPGAYVIAETDPGSVWSTVVSGSPASVPEDGTGTTASVSNTRKLGSLQVTKTVDWNGVAVNPAQSFQICIAGPSFPDGNCQALGANGGVLAWANLAPGSYSVMETAPGSEWTVVVEGSPALVPADGGEAAVSVRNTRKRGSLQVTKVVDWNGVPGDETQTFQICIQGPTHPDGNCQVVGAGGGVRTWPDLIPGSYVLAESDPGARWLVTYSSTAVTVPADGTTAAASVTNTRKRGSLTVSKVANWNGIAVEDEQSFALCITGPSFLDGDCRSVGPNGGAANWLDLLPGDYTVSETLPGIQWSVVISPSIVTVPEDGAGMAASVVNTRRLGSLAVRKIVAWGDVAPDNQKMFTICISGPSYPAGNCKTLGFGGGALLWSGLLPGTYNVAETNPGSVWTVGVVGAPAVVPLDGGQAQVTVTNTRLAPARISVTKVVSEPGTPTWSFVLRLDGVSAKTVTRDQPTATWEGLDPNRSYRLSEDEAGAAWEEGAFTCQVDNTTVGEVVDSADMQLALRAGDDVACVKYNSEIRGTDEEPVDEPSSRPSVYLPTITR